MEQGDATRTKDVRVLLVLSRKEEISSAEADKLVEALNEVEGW